MPNLKLKDTLTKYPRSVLDENDDMSALSLSNESVRINGSLEITDVPASEFDTNQYLVLDGDTVKTRNVPGDISSISFTSLDDFSTQNISSGVADFVTDGSNGITTEIAAGPIIKITGEDASTSNKGVAKFNTANFSVSSGDVTIKDGGVDLTAEVTGELPNANVADLPTSKITSGTMADARIASSNVTQHEGDIDAVGVLASGSIASGFGTIVTGNKISTTAGLESAKLDVEAATLTASTAGTDTAIDISQTLNAGSGENNAMVVEKYAMLRGVLTETDAAGWDSKYFMQMVGGSGGDTDKFTTDISGNVVSAGTITSSNGVCGGGRFQVQGQYEVYGRYGSVNTWYTGNQSYGTSIAVADWSTGGTKYNYAQFTASAQVKLQSWTFNGSFSTTKDYELEMWHVEAPSNGSSTPDAATKVGSTQSITASAARLYVIKDDDLDYTIPISDQLYLLTRYTDGSGTVYQYGTVGMEFSYD